MYPWSSLPSTRAAQWVGGSLSSAVRTVVQSWNWRGLMNPSSRDILKLVNYLLPESQWDSPQDWVSLLCSTSLPEKQQARFPERCCLSDRAEYNGGIPWHSPLAFTYMDAQTSHTHTHTALLFHLCADMAQGHGRSVGKSPSSWAERAQIGSSHAPYGEGMVRNCFHLLCMSCPYEVTLHNHKSWWLLGDFFTPLESWELLHGHRYPTGFYPPLQTCQYMDDLSACAYLDQTTRSMSFCDISLTLRLLSGLFSAPQLAKESLARW